MERHPDARWLHEVLDPVLAGTSFECDERGGAALDSGGSPTVAELWCAPLDHVVKRFPGIPIGAGNEVGSGHCVDLLIEAVGGFMTRADVDAYSLAETFRHLEMSQEAERSEALIGMRLSDAVPRLVELIALLLVAASPMGMTQRTTTPHRENLH